MSGWQIALAVYAVLLLIVGVFAIGAFNTSGYLSRQEEERNPLYREGEPR